MDLEWLSLGLAKLEARMQILWKFLLVSMLKRIVIVAIGINYS